MAVIQAKQEEIRYIRRKNLHEEARIIGSWYRDCIRQYGIDCVYHKMDMSEFSDFKDIVDQNAILKRAYGYDIDPSYEISAQMISFAEIDSDIFQLNKYGIQPQTEINLYFDSTQFACDLAPKVGQYKEYKIDSVYVSCEVPAIVSDITSYVDESGEVVSGYLSDDVWPYQLDLGPAETYTCNMLSGKMRCVLSGYSVEQRATAACDPYEHTDFNVVFPQNADLYHSLKYKIQNDEYLETLLFLTYTVKKVTDDRGYDKFILTGRTHGSLLFFNLDQLGKYCERIHPMVGDVVEIDFPDDQNREKYDITDCFDKQLTQDGINPLLHKYVWKCKAKRRLEEDYEGLDQTEADRRYEERRRYEDTVQEQVADEVSRYDVIDDEKGVREDAVYGGYENTVEPLYDKQKAGPDTHRKYDSLPRKFIDELVIHRFGCGSRLSTNGYDLFFTDVNGEQSNVAMYDRDLPTDTAVFECGLRWMKATDSQIVFVNMQDQSSVLSFDELATDGQMEISINSLYDSTVDTGEINRAADNFLKFKGTRTLMWSDGYRLYAKLQSNGCVYVIA